MFNFVKEAIELLMLSNIVLKLESSCQNQVTSPDLANCTILQSQYHLQYLAPPKTCSKTAG